MLAAPDQDPTPEEATALFQALQKHFPSTTLGDDKWYLIAVAALSGSPYPDLVASLYTYLTSLPAYSTPSSRQALVRRIREALVKNVSIIGVCKPIEAIIALDAAEQPEDKDYTFTREHWTSGPDNSARGKAWLSQLYQGDLAGIFSKFAAHKDFEWISTEITYGLYLSDHSILDGLETELVVLSGIMIQNLKLESGWHLRAVRRIGVGMEDVERIQQCIEMVAEFAGVRLNRIPRVDDVEHEV